MKRFDLIDRLGLLVGVAAVLGSLSGCASAPRPKALDDASTMLTHHDAVELETLKPKLIREAKSYLRKATEAHARGDQREAELYAHMAMNRFMTAQNLVKSTSARRLAKEMVARRGSVAGEADQLRSRQAELKRFRALEQRIALIHADLSKKPEGDAPNVVAAKRALSRARRKQAEAIGAGAPAAAPAAYQQGLSLVTSAVESLELSIFSEAKQSADQAVVAFDGAIAKARAPKAEPPPDPSLAAKAEAEDALTAASSAQALALAAGAPQTQPNVYQRGKVLLSSAERSFDRKNYPGASKLARQAKDAFDAASAGPTAAPVTPAGSPGFDAASAGTIFDNRPIGQILLSLRFERASMLGERKNETCPATFKEFEAILELADERLKMGDLMSTREFVIRAQERLAKCGKAELAVAPPEAAVAKVDPAQAIAKQNAASAIQKAQTALAQAKRTIPNDPRLGQPAALLASAEKWFDRGSHTQAEQLADQAVIALATIGASPAPAPTATKVDTPAGDPVKDEAAALLQKGQTLHAELIAKLGDDKDKRLALPSRRLQAAERWFDRGRYTQARDEAKQALTLLAKLDRELKTTAKPKADEAKTKTPEQVSAEAAIEAAKDARVKAVVALVPDEDLEAPDKLLGLADKALEQGRAKAAILYAKKAEQVFLEAAKPKPRVEVVTVPKKPAATNVCRQAFLKIAHAERLANNTKGAHLTAAQRREHAKGESLATIANVRMNANKCEEALVLGEEAVGTLFPLPLRPASMAKPKAKKPTAKKPTAKKPKAKKPKAKKPTAKKPVSSSKKLPPPTSSWKVAYEKTRRALEKRDEADQVLIAAMKPTMARGNRALAAGRRAYDAKRYGDAGRHADVAIAQFEAVIAASSVAVAPTPRPGGVAAPPPRPGEPASPPKTGPRPKTKTPEPAWKGPYRTIFAALEMQKEAKKIAKTDDAKKALTTGEGYMAKSQVAWKAKKYRTAQTHATAAMVAFKIAIDTAKKEKPAVIAYEDADASLREARVIMSVCERDKCAERDFKALESAKQMLASAEEAMKKSNYAYAHDLAQKAKTAMLEILDKPRPDAPKPAAEDPDKVKKAKDAIAEAQIQRKLCGARECNKLNLEGWLRAEQDLAAARSALADGDADRAVRLAEKSEATFKSIEAPKASTPSFTIPADVKSVSRAGSQLYVKPPVAFRTGSTLVDRSSKPSIEALAKVLKANASLLKSVRLIGFTDNRGSAGLNKAISAKRAQSVVKALTLEGVDQALMSSEGRGQESPVADNSTAEGRAANRRVEIHIELK